MKISVNFTVEIDADQWSRYHGILKDEVRQDVREYLLNHVQCAPCVEEADGKAELKS